MASFFQQVFSLLTTDTGSLTYHLVLAFSIVGALQAAIAVSRSGRQPAGQRMVLGLTLMLLVRVVLFATAGLVWQGLANGALLLPMVDRAAGLLSLIPIVWLWVFPQPSRPGDAAAILMGMLGVTLAILGVVWYSSQGSGQAFNGSWPDLIAEVAALLLLAFGALLLAVRRTEGWGVGLTMLLLLAAGHLAHLMYPIPNSDYAGAVRLAHIAAYPLLLALPQRFPPAVSAPALAPELTAALAAALQASAGLSEPEPGQVAPIPALPAGVFQPFLALARESSRPALCEALAAAVAQFMQAEMCLLLAQSPEEPLGIQCGYDLARRQAVSPAALDPFLLPALTDAAAALEPLRLETAPDLAALAEALHLRQTGPLLAVPFGSWMVVLLSPYTGRVWTDLDQANLARFAAALAPVLERMRREQGFEANLAQLESSLASARTQVEEAQSEGLKLQEQLTTLRQRSSADRAQLESLAAMVAAQETAQDTISRLQTEIQNLKQATMLASELHPTEAERPVEPDRSEEVDRIEGELRLALEEVARLRMALTEADEKLLVLQREAAQEPEAALPPEKLEEIASLTQELRQPMASIVGYTDVLLGESVGILGTLQRKFLERIKGASERAARLMDGLSRLTSSNGTASELDDEQVDLEYAVQEARTSVIDLLREKSIDLQVEVPTGLPALNADPDAVQQVLVRLLRNAAIVTPPEGAVRLQARLETLEGQPDWVLLQVSDTGGGIPADQVAKVFNRFTRPDSQPIPGVGESAAELSIARALVDSLGGRIWVDSQENQGATFSLLLPVMHPETPELRANESVP